MLQQLGPLVALEYGDRAEAKQASPSLVRQRADASESVVLHWLTQDQRAADSTGFFPIFRVARQTVRRTSRVPEEVLAPSRTDIGW